MRDLQRRLTGVRAVFVNSVKHYQEVAWLVQMAGTDSMSPRPAVFCGFQHDEPDADPGLTLPLTNDERELAAIENWRTVHPESNAVEVERPMSVSHVPQLAELLQPTPLRRVGIGYRERRIVTAITEGAALLRSAGSAGEDAVQALQVNMADYEVARRMLCSLIVRPNQELCEPLTADMLNRANVYLAVKLCGDRESPFWSPDGDGYRRSRESSLKRDAITRRELVDLGNVRSRTIERLIEYLQRIDSGFLEYGRMGLMGEPIAEVTWRRSSPRELARRLTSWSIKQVRTHFDRLHRQGLITVERQQANGPLHYRLPEELENARSPYSRLPSVRSLTDNRSVA
jgi:hypothetical protein